MRNMKYWLLIIALLFTLLFVAITSFISVINVNDHSAWISEQVKKNTGYDVRFEHFENQWTTYKRFTFSGVSLHQQQQQVAFIGKIELAVEKLDLWQRQLEIKSINLSDVDINVDWPLRLNHVTFQNEGEPNSQIAKLTGMQNINWDRLNIATLNIDNLNVALKFDDKNFVLKEANLAFNELLIINRHQLQTFPTNLDFITTFKALQASNNKQKVEVNDFSLMAHVNLLKREGEMKMSAAEVSSINADLPPVLLSALQLKLQLEQQKLSLTHFFVNAFSGSLAITADLFLEFNFLPKPAIAVKKLQVLALTAKDIQLNIPEFFEKNTSTASTSEQLRLPIQSLSVKNASLHNISIFSDVKNFPLALKSADAQISNWLVVDNNQLIDLAQESQQQANFAFTFESLRWRNSVVEEFSIVSRFDKQQQEFAVLKKLLSK